MAERRMFAKTIVLSDAFLDMPLTARCLYFTLGMVADDDGFVNAPKAIMRQCGSSIDDMNLLLAKKFILQFESGVIVIKHWRINNYLRNDRYAATKYLDEKNSLTVEENGAYTLGIPNTVYPDKDRLGKDRLDSDTRHKYGAYKNVLLSDTDLSKLQSEFPNDYELRIERLSEYIQSKGAKYKDHLATIRAWARRDIERRNDKLSVSKPQSERQYTQEDLASRVHDPLADL